MMDKLECILKQYQRATLLYYDFVLEKSKDKKQIEVRLELKKENFAHLAGIHHLKDIKTVSKYKGRKFNQLVMAGKITYHDLKKSYFFAQYQSRIEGCGQMRELLMGRHRFFRDFDQRKCHYYSLLPDLSTVSDCKQIRLTNQKGQSYHLLIAKRSKVYYPVSFFPTLQGKNPEIHQDKYTIISSCVVQR